MHNKSYKDLMKESKTLSDYGKKKTWHRNVPRSVGEADEPRINGIKRTNKNYDINHNSIPLKRNGRYLIVNNSNPKDTHQVHFCIIYFLVMFRF